ncbi:MAG: hypothetical protein DIZ80_03690 [endosymbiont of Galathealinum brachiosum]|uniref:histidine kinase n=1 Tax=endosymbiont of Galathealinum brachiosum TaxID=2200906 RepID=A0A370DJ41_9GAMM|nr:MAG: hypothetical protein DIZ80_03690 [endosymbiont of Galathealinum brachiosum]
MVKLTIVHKLIIGAIMLVLISSYTVGSLFYNKTKELLVQQTIQNIEGETLSVGASIIAHIDALQNDVSFLLKTPPIQGMLRAGKAIDKYDEQGKSSYQLWEQRLETIFETMLSSKRTYLRIRFIDKNGVEQIVVVRRAGEIITLEADKHQDKSSRDYVIETLKLKPDSIYLSEFNLNRENGVVEVPYREVIRSATPVYDIQSGEIEGLIVITAEVGFELREIQEKIQGKDNKIYITNDQGGYLLHPDSRKSYGFSMGKRYRIQEEFPQLSHLYLPDNKDKGLVLLPGDTGGKNVMNVVKMPFDPVHPERFIIVGITEPYSIVFNKVNTVLNEVVMLALLMSSVIIIFAIIWSYRLTYPIKQITKVMDDYTNKRVSRVVLPVHQTDEIGILAQSYQSMIAQVKDVQSNLEIKVKERTNDLLVARDEAEHANAAKSEFLSRMSHELRTPMNAILGFAQMLQLDMEGFNRYQKGNVKEILDAGQHLLDLINEVLDLARIESGKLDIQLEKVYVDDVLEQCLKLVSVNADERQIKIIDSIKGKGYSVQADYTRLKQVILNLLSNAVKYNAEEGEIMIESKILSCDFLRICITDSGECLTDDKISRLFTPFDRLNVEQNVEGTGIGLVITKHLVEAMGGNIGVECNKGVGSTFWFDLKLYEVIESV